MSSFKDLKKESLALYKKLREEKIFCPAFQEEVQFTLMGWEHLVGSDRRHRSLKDVYRRLMLLPLAKDILQKSGTVQSVRTTRGVTTYGLDSIETVEIKGVKVTLKVRVIVRDTKTGKKFYSIMDRKLKSK